MKYSITALALGLMLFSASMIQAAQQTLFLSVQDNKHKRRVTALQEMLKRHGGDIRTDRFEKASKGEKGYRYNAVLIVPEKVAKILKESMGATVIKALSARVTFKSKAGLFSKTVNQLTVDCPQTGFEETFSWYKNVFSSDPWTYFKDNFASDFALHVKQVDHGGKAKLRVKKPYMKLELFPKGMKATAASIFFETEEKLGDLYFDAKEGE